MSESSMGTERKNCRSKCLQCPSQGVEPDISLAWHPYGRGAFAHQDAIRCLKGLCT